MNSHSLKQVFHRGGGEAKNLASILDFYYEMPPLIHPAAAPKHILDKYPQLIVSQVSDPFKFDSPQHQLGIDQAPLLDLNDTEDLKLFELLLTVTSSPGEFMWYNHMAVAGNT